MEQAAIINSKLEDLTKKLDEHGDDLKAMRKDLSMIALQTERLNNHQAMINEMRGDINEIERKLLPITNHQASCPRDDLRELRVWFIAIAGLIGTIMIYHMFGGKP